MLEIIWEREIDRDSARETETEMEEHDVVIVGAGIAGLAASIALKRVGVKALVLEKSEELRATGAAIGLHPNAWLAVEALGVAHKLTTTTYPPLRKYLSFAPFSFHEFPLSISDNNYVFLCHFKFLHEIFGPLKTFCSLLFAHTLASIHVSPLKYFILF